MNKDELAVGGDVELSKLKFYNYKGSEIDIFNVFTEIEIYEDIHSHSLSGSITIVDTNNLIKNFPIIGEEKIEIVYKTPGFDQKHEVSQTFYVYKMGNIITPTPHKQVYTLYFTTPEAIIDLNARVFKAFSGTPCSIIKSLLTTGGLNSKKPYVITICNNNIKFVGPSWNPFKCINYIASRAQSNDSFKASNFIFYETNKSYRFDSINSIFGANKEPNITYKYSNDPARNSTGDASVRNVQAELEKIYTLSIDERFNMMERFDRGFYSHFVWDHNILLKKLTKRAYQYGEHFGKTNHLDKAPVSSSALSIAKNTLLSSVVTYPQSHDGIAEDTYGKIITNKFPLMEQLDALRIDIVVNGRSDLEAGMLVNMKIGGLEYIAPEDKNKDLEDRYDGRYMIVSILHRITAKKHQMVMRMARESVKDPYS